MSLWANSGHAKAATTASIPRHSVDDARDRPVWSRSLLIQINFTWRVPV